MIFHLKDRRISQSCLARMSKIISNFQAFVIKSENCSIPCVVKTCCSVLLLFRMSQITASLNSIKSVKQLPIHWLVSRWIHTQIFHYTKNGEWNSEPSNNKSSFGCFYWTHSHSVLEIDEIYFIINISIGKTQNSQ